jgi:hypothetical protein
MTLHPDMVPSSSGTPAKKNILQRLNLQIIGGIFIGLVILGLIWYSLAGPGKPILEQKLASLVNLEATSTQQADPSPIPVTKTPPEPSKTPKASPTTRRTNTPTSRIIASPTLSPATTTPTSSNACRDVLTITLVDVGQTLCVQGTVIEIVDRPNNFMLVFSKEKNAFYWVSYDMIWKAAEVNTCYQIHGMIRQIASSPILVFDYSNIPMVCP